jgi:hypothetical protein
VSHAMPCNAFTHVGRILEYGLHIEIAGEQSRAMDAVRVPNNIAAEKYSSAGEEDKADKRTSKR